jgi:hypothetical protein
LSQTRIVFRAISFSFKFDRSGGESLEKREQ